MFSVLRVVPPPLDDPGRDVGRGRVEGVPGTPPTFAEPLRSSVFWDEIMTDLLGSKVSSLCSPPEKSHSTDTPARNFSGPRRGSSVEFTLTRTSFSMRCL